MKTLPDPLSKPYREDIDPQRAGDARSPDSANQDTNRFPPEISTDSADESSIHRNVRQKTIVLGGILAIACLLAWLQHRTLASAIDTQDTASRQLAQMRTDAGRILALREAPKAAAARTRQSDELLAQVESALHAAGIPRSAWLDSVPQPPTRLPRSNYKQLTTRLYYEDITLKQLTTFTHHLRSTDPTLQISSLTLTNRHPEGPAYDINLAIAYLVYAPLP